MRTDSASYVCMTVMEHRASAALDGTRPTVSEQPLLDDRGVYTFAATNGGLLVWSNPEPILLQQLLIHLDGPGDVDVHLVNVDSAGAVVAGSEYLMYSAAGVTNLALLETEFRISLQQNQALRVTTDQAGRCAVWCKIERGTVR